MSLRLLAAWLDGFRSVPGRSVWADENAGRFCLDPGDGPLIALEWDAEGHGVHLYANPGHATAAGWARANDDEDEAIADADADDAFASHAVECDLSSSEHERRTLHVDADGGLITLSVHRSLASLSRAEFDELLEDFIADAATWSRVFADPAVLGYSPVVGGDPGHRITRNYR